MDKIYSKLSQVSLMRVTIYNIPTPNHSCLELMNHIHLCTDFEYKKNGIKLSKPMVEDLFHAIQLYLYANRRTRSLVKKSSGQYE